MTSKPARLRTLVPAAIALLAAVAGQAHASATIIINNVNAADVGFNDTTPAAPVGGNTGTTLGEQRLIAFTYAANIWGATLTSSQPIVINAQFSALACTANSAALGSAGATSVFRDNPAFAKAGTWYSYALANKLAGAELGTANAAQISANFNVNLGLNANCLPGTYWYLGLDNNHGNNIDLVTVLMHEMGHGIGFQTFTNGETGAYNGSYPSIWDWYLTDTSTGLAWKDMTAAQRAASAISGDGLVWTGPLVTAAVPSVLRPSTAALVVNGPTAGTATGQYRVGEASFGPPLNLRGVYGQVMPVAEQTRAAGAGCETFNAANATAVHGKIALIDRGVCTYTVKVKNAQNAGAIGVIIADNAAGTPPAALSGSDATIAISAVRVSKADGATIKASLTVRSRTVSGVFATLGLKTGRYAGADPLGRALLYAPNPYISGSSVSHFDVSAFPNQLMEPNINADLTHSVIPQQDLTFLLLKDIGW